MVDQLEKRILELKQATRAPLNKPIHPPSRTEWVVEVSNDRDECVANLLAEGPVAAVANEPQKAWNGFDWRWAATETRRCAGQKKGGALEKLAKLDEAIACYGHAIEAEVNDHAYFTRGVCKTACRL